MINSKPLHYYPYQFTTNKSHINPKYVLYTKVYNSIIIVEASHHRGHCNYQTDVLPQLKMVPASINL